MLTAFVVTRALVFVGDSGDAPLTDGAGMSEREGVEAPLDFLHGAGMNAQCEAKRTVQDADDEELQASMMWSLPRGTVEGKIRLSSPGPLPEERRWEKKWCSPQIVRSAILARDAT